MQIGGSSATSVTSNHHVARLVLLIASDTNAEYGTRNRHVSMGVEMHADLLVLYCVGGVPFGPGLLVAHRVERLVDEN